MITDTCCRRRTAQPTAIDRMVGAGDQSKRRREMMSTDFRSLTPIRMTDLFDGRLEDVGIREDIILPGTTCELEGITGLIPLMPTTADERLLTNGRDFLWVSER